MKQAIKRLVNKLPYIRGLYEKNIWLRAQLEEYKRNTHFPPGHYYSPLVSFEEVKRRETQIWKGEAVDGVLEIDLRTAEQIALVQKFSAFYPELPFTEGPQEGLRYFFENDFFLQSDAILLYSMLRHFQPQQVVEIGSGFSSAIMLDTRERFFTTPLQLTFIEPFPERLQSLMTSRDAETSTVLCKPIQDVEPEFFRKLGDGDILFVDSTHVSKAGSDVNYIFFEILPMLRSGVIIHFHDIFYPFEYTREWVMEGRNWNEAYLLRGFLMNNPAYEVLLFPHYLHTLHKAAFAELPLCYKNTGGSFWMRKR